MILTDPEGAHSIPSIAESISDERLIPPSPPPRRQSFPLPDAMTSMYAPNIPNNIAKTSVTSLTNQEDRRYPLNVYNVAYREIGEKRRVQKPRPTSDVAQYKGKN